MNHTSEARLAGAAELVDAVHADCAINTRVAGTLVVIKLTPCTYTHNYISYK